MARAKAARYGDAMPRLLSALPSDSSGGRHAVAEAVRLLRAGGVVAIPTETVYGLAARVFDEAAVARVYAIKNRPPGHPLIAHVEGEAQARALAASWPERASEVARAFWPGPVTVVVERAEHVPAAVAGGGDSLAIRAPAHPVALALLSALGEPLAAPSANRFQGLSPTTAEHVVKQLGDAVDLVLDAGACDAGIESTVVDLRSSRPRVLRPGAIGLASLRRILPDIEATAQTVRGAEPRVSPGMEARHYAPRAPLILADTWGAAARTADGLAATGARVGLVTYEPTATSHDTRILLRTLPRDPSAYARELYRTLHDLDDARVDAIVVQRVPDDEAWWAVADRLKRGASSGHGHGHGHETKT
jgi:L-threonylcarbamoyladenylate synthase